MNLITLLDFSGTFVFAISGVLSASGKRLDWFGALFIGFVTAVGGGTTRDVLLGSHPVFWMKDSIPLLVIFSAVIFTFLFKRYILPLKKPLFIFDTIGLGIFTIIGLEKALSFGINPIAAVMMGMVTAVMGGIIRDTLCNDIPLIFRKEIYATPCLIGGGLYLLLDAYYIPKDIIIISTVMLIIMIRILAVRFKWSLPEA